MDYLDKDEIEMNFRIEKYQCEIKKAKELQQKYVFEIPMYVLEEMENVTINTFIAIWIAEKNGRISHENADILRKDLRKRTRIH